LPRTRPQTHRRVSTNKTLAERIEARLNLALTHQERAELEVVDARRGLASGGPGRLVIRLSLADVAGIAAAVVEDV
jgi:hypothetical protein